MKLFGVVSLILVLVATMIFGCAAPATTPQPTPSPKPAPAPVEPIKLSFASISGPTHANTGAFEAWIKDVEEATNGQVSITLYPAGGLINVLDTYKGVVEGTGDIGYALSSFTPGRFPLSSLFDLPFMFPSSQLGTPMLWHLHRMFPEMVDEWNDTKTLAHWCVTPANILTKKQINKFEDLKGVRLGVTGKVANRVAELWGATPVNMPAQEVYVALSQNVIEGTGMPKEAAETNKFYEACKYLFEPPVYGGSMFCVMNKKSFDSLPADVQTAIEGLIGEQFSMRMAEALDERDVVAGEKMKAQGMTINTLPEAEFAKLREASIPMYDEWIAEMEGKGLPGRKIFDEAVRYMEEHK